MRIFYEYGSAADGRANQLSLTTFISRLPSRRAPFSVTTTESPNCAVPPLFNRKAGLTSNTIAACSTICPTAPAEPPRGRVPSPPEWINLKSTNVYGMLKSPSEMLLLEMAPSWFNWGLDAALLLATIRPEQDATLTLGGDSGLIDVHTTPTSTLTFGLGVVPPGAQWVRLTVDGVESLLVDRFRSRIHDELASGDLGATVDSVADGEVDPYSAADRILARPGRS